MSKYEDESTLLSALSKSDIPLIQDLFKDGSPVYIARAPGRLDLMGGIADYSGSLVLQWPIQEATWAVVQPTRERKISIASVDAVENGRSAQETLALDALEENGKPAPYASVRAELSKNSQARWSAYVFGVFLVLMHERGISFDSGARIVIASDVPEGKGVSASAALEVSTMNAVAAAFDIKLTPRELGILCQIVENQVVGAPCGAMDQMTSACADSNCLMELLCRPAELLGNVALPDSLELWGIDSGVRHAVVGDYYGNVRTATFMGLALLKRVSKKPCKYLTEFSPSELEQRYVTNLPAHMIGRDFLVDLGAVDDDCSVINPTTEYPVRAATSHAVYEHARVSLFAELLTGEMTQKRAMLLGELMYQSHASYSSCGLGSLATDQIVDLVRKAGVDRGLYGAKITGGGSGGTVVVLASAGSRESIDEIAQEYTYEANHKPYIFSGSSIGASKYGVRHLKLDGTLVES